MSSHLTPTTVTDINGRVTTVHKRLDARQSVQKKTKVPAPALKPETPARAASVTPLVMPEPLTESQLKEFYEWQAPHAESLKFRKEVKDVMLKPFDGPTQALAWRIITERSVPEDTVVSLLTKYHSRRQTQLAKMFGYKQETLLRRLRNQLLLAEKLGTEHHEDAHTKGWLHETFLSKAEEGYCYKPKLEDRHSPEPIKTEEELASLTAVSAFLLRARVSGNTDQYRETEYGNSEGEKVGAVYMANRSLDAFLRENPHEVHRVLTHVGERGIGNTVKDTKKLVAWLAETEDATALSDGWL